MNILHKPNKSLALLQKISAHDLVQETKLLSDPGLNELFSWHTKRSARARLKDTLAVLVKQADLTIGQLGNNKIYQITDKGRQKIARLSMLRVNPVSRPSVWNRRWYLVAYHIPDQNKSSRNQFIAGLKILGFKRYAPALWINPYDLVTDVNKIAKHYQVAQYISHVRADTISHASQWQKTFSVK